jgi:hypothetical protein
MVLGPYLLDGIVHATTPPNETADAARIRREAIIEMVQAYDPADAVEGMIVSHCILLQFVEFGAIRDANNTSLPPAVVTRNRAQAISVSRTLLQWVTKLENAKKRSLALEKAAREAEIEAQTAAAAPAPEPAPANPKPPVATPIQPRPMPPDGPASQTPVQNGRAAAPAVPPREAADSAPLGTSGARPPVAMAAAAGRT